MTAVTVTASKFCTKCDRLTDHQTHRHAEAIQDHRQAAAWQRRYEQYAGRFLAEHDDPENCDDRAEPTDAAMAATFAPCGRPAKPEWYPHIRAAIRRQRADRQDHP